MERSKNIERLAGALARAQGKFEAVKRSGVNPRFRSYATLDDVIAAVREPLSSEAIAYTQLIGQDELGYSLTTMLIHESGQFLSETMRVIPENLVSGAGKKVRNDLQELGSAVTYTKRYMLSSMLGVNSEFDDDGNASGQLRNGKRQAPPPQSAQAKAAQEQKALAEQERTTTKDKLIVRGQEVGLLSDPLKGDEWGPFYAILGDVYTALRATNAPDGGFGKLLKPGLALIEAAAIAPESETVEDDTDALDDDAYGHDLPPAE